MALHVLVEGDGGTYSSGATETQVEVTAPHVGIDYATPTDVHAQVEGGGIGVNILAPGYSGAGAGDMLKSVYDTDDDGIVDAAEDAALLGGLPAAAFAPADHGHAHNDLTGVTSDQHHPQIHDLIDPVNHPVAGLTPGHVMTALTPTTCGFAAPTGGGEDHDLLSATHPDTNAAASAQHSLIMGDGGTPSKWTASPYTDPLPRAGIHNPAGGLQVQAPALGDVELFAQGTDQNRLLKMWGQRAGDTLKYGAFGVDDAGDFQITNSPGEKMLIDAGGDLHFQPNFAGNVIFFASTGAGDPLRQFRFVGYDNVEMQALESAFYYDAQGAFVVRAYNDDLALSVPQNRKIQLQIEAGGAGYVYVGASPVPTHLTGGSGDLLVMKDLEIDGQLFIDVAEGTAPISCVSTTVCPGLNASLLDGNEATAFALAGHGHAHGDLSGVSADQHHAQIHDLVDATNHPVAGLTVGHVMTALTATTYGFAAPAGGGAHELLSAAHPDTAPGLPVRGSLIVGNATPLWAALAKGASGSFLRADANDAFWGSIAGEDITAGIIADEHLSTNIPRLGAAQNLWTGAQFLYGESSMLYAYRGADAEYSAIRLVQANKSNNMLGVWPFHLTCDDEDGAKDHLAVIDTYLLEGGEALGVTPTAGLLVRSRGNTATSGLLVQVEGEGHGLRLSSTGGSRGAAFLGTCNGSGAGFAMTMFGLGTGAYFCALGGGKPFDFITGGATQVAGTFDCNATFASGRRLDLSAGKGRMPTTVDAAPVAGSWYWDDPNNRLYIYRATATAGWKYVTLS